MKQIERKIESGRRRRINENSIKAPDPKRIIPFHFYLME